MSEEKIEKGIYDVKSAEKDFYKCIEYENRICNGENVIIESNKFAVEKVIEILGKSPEIIWKNGVVANNDPITMKTALRSLATAKQVIYDQFLKDSANLAKDSLDELKKK